MRLLCRLLLDRRVRVLAVYGYRGPVRQAALLAARLRRLQVVTRSDSNISAVAEDKAWVRNVRRWLLRALYPRSTRVWVIGEANRNFWETYVGRTNTMLARYSTPRLPTSLGIPPSRRTSDPSRMRFLFIGRLIEVKYIESLIAAFARLRSVEHAGWSLDVVGDGPLRAALEEQAAEDARIVFHGARAYDDLDRYYLNADVLVLPSSKEAWGLVVNEALAFGLWVIVSNAAGAAELITDSSIGVVYPVGDVDVLAECLRAAGEHLERMPIPPTDPTQIMAADLTRLLDATTTR